jgi:hypothetical protein
MVEIMVESISDGLVPVNGRGKMLALARRALRGSEWENWMFTRGLPARQKHGLAAPGYFQAALTGLSE